jgi:hypothetical protein
MIKLSLKHCNLLLFAFHSGCGMFPSPQQPTETPPQISYNGQNFDFSVPSNKYRNIYVNQEDSQYIETLNRY